MTIDLYAIVEVERGASARQIRGAYRRLPRACHSDPTAEADAAERFKRVAGAYAVLSDTSRRAAYDQWGYAPTSSSSTVNIDEDGDFAFE